MNSCDVVYDKQGSLSKRGTSLGYGKRFKDLIGKSVAPTPQKYSLPDTKDKRSFSFGMSRDKFDKVSLKKSLKKV